MISIRFSLKLHVKKLIGLKHGVRKLSYITENTMDHRKHLVGVCQMTSTADKEANFQTCKTLICQAKRQGAVVVFLPECFDYVGEKREQSIGMAETLQGETISRYRALAKETKVWLSLGGFHHKGPKDSPNKVMNMHVMITDDGEIKATYTKTHLFDIHGDANLMESEYTVAGKEIVPPVASPVGHIGLQICYDLRFPELSLSLTELGAEILTFPSAFTEKTGMAHWQALLRSRAIESQCYVIAAAQTGRHNNRRSSYGHAMIVDPWGTVIGECREGVHVCVAEIDLDYLHLVRSKMPVQTHRRRDLYGHLQHFSIMDIESEDTYQFGSHLVRSSQIFYRSALTIGLVNIKPVVPGHVLVAPIRPARRFSDLTQQEVADLFSSAQKISRVVEKEWGANAVTVAIQDGKDAGQTVEVVRTSCALVFYYAKRHQDAELHVHVHILPRKEGDFAFNDDIYKELDEHDKDVQSNNKSNLRSEEEMAKEANRLRELFK